MINKDGDGLDVFLFAEGADLVDFKCFRGDRDDISEGDIRAQIHSALMQRKMKRADISQDPPEAGVAVVDVREFVAEMAKGC
jgi:hypothetical protein